MNKKIHQVFFLFLLLTAPCTWAQLIKDEFNSIAFSDQFDDEKDNWRNMSTSDNLFMIQEGEYLLRRKNTSSGYSIFPKWKNNLASFSLAASIKLEEGKNDESAVGLIFMAQEDASGAFVFEFNSKGQFRLKQLVGLSFKLLTGDVKSSGWVESEALRKNGEYNLVEIRTAKRNYDIYVNSKYLLSFTEIAYKSGDIGISIGPGTKARLDYIVVKEPKSEAGKAIGASSATAAGSKPSGKNDSSASGTSDVTKLNEQVSALKSENQALRDTILLLRKKLKATRVDSNQEQ